MQAPIRTGKPKLPPEERRVKLSPPFVLPETARKLKPLIRKHRSIGRVLDSILSE